MGKGPMLNIIEVQNGVWSQLLLEAVCVSCTDGCTFVRVFLVRCSQTGFSDMGVHAGVSSGGCSGS